MKTKRTSSRKPRSPKPVAAPSPARKPAAAPPRGPLRIVGLGCSAGGLEACIEFFTGLPANTGMAFVVVSHLDPDHKGIMPELLQRYTAMQVCQAEDGMKLRPNRVYVIPPNRDLSILHGKLQLMEPSAPRGLRTPIDFFFKHLAQDQHDHSVGVILSGMGTDGTQGLKVIKEELGLVMAQDPASAKYDAMPHSAIGTGLVDIVAPAKELPARLVRFVRHTTTLPRLAPAEAEIPSSALQKIFVLLRARTGVDFSGYKPATIYRRVERRMGIHQLQPLPRYVRYMQENPPEADLLFRELLIGVTSFFRDPAAFAVLKEKALPRLLHRKGAGGPIRVWVPGCSTGEEAYSVAMALTECLDRSPREGEFTLQVFATDLDKDAIEKARQGAFPASLAADMPAERLKRFFTRTEHGYTIKKSLRERVVFAPQNVLTDPPFTKVDLLCCRNLLIYLNPEWQKKLLALFHYALNPGGLLFLGSAETISGFSDLYAPLDGRWKIFERKESPAGLREMAGMPGPHPQSEAPPPAPERKAAPPGPAVADVAQRLLLDTYVPPAVVITPEGDLVYVVGRTGKYLEPASGKVNLNVFAMAREGLALELGLAIRNAVQRRDSVTVRNLRVKTNGAWQVINLTVKPLAGAPGPGGLLLVAFEDAEPEESRGKGVRPGKPSLRSHASGKALEKELHQTKAQLQSTIEETQATQEELKAANEEMQSNNEELQSTNEELTTSKEELQSLNEEMTTVNSELQTKLDELAQVNADMKNLLNGLDVATIFADNELRIKRFTPQATRIINLIPTDVNRPLRDLVTKLKYEHLVDDAKQVLSTLVFKAAEVQTADGRWHLMRILPYRTTDNVIDGVVFTFTDITPLKQLEASLRETQTALEEARMLSENIFHAMRDPLLVLDAELRIVSANCAFYAAFRVTPNQTERESLFQVGNRQWDVPELKRLLQEVLPRQTELRGFRVEHTFPGLGHKVMLLNARRIERPAPRPPLILLAIEDITKE
ncbi:MAG: PAS domain-containing protein [Verrucomicrobia bacterium]|nr:PAS domain-containing protein [Verrucomicrobiota bacterium]